MRTCLGIQTFLEQLPCLPYVFSLATGIKPGFLQDLGFYENICSIRSLQLKNGYSEELELSSILLQIISKQVKIQKVFFSQD